MTDVQPTTEPSAPTLAPYLPRFLIEWARDDPGAGFRELDGSLVSVDISGFTSLSERLATKGRIGAEELILLISGVFEGLIGVAHRLGGDVLKFRGDALLLLFAGEAHEQRACGAASGMQWFIETAGSTMSSVGPVELRMSTGIYSGPCQFFLVDASHKELLVVGPAATRTFELEDTSEAGEILVSARTAEALAPEALGDDRDGARLLLRDQPELEAEPTSNNLLLAEVGLSLEDYVPVPLRAHLALASGEAEHRQVTVAFVKFSDTDGIVEREGPEALAAKLQALAEVVGDACSAYGVTWLESDIDRDAGKFYLTAGAPSSTGSDEEAMLRTLREVLDGGGELPLRAGVNRGRAFAGDIGASSRRTYAVMGDAVNLGARLCGRAEIGQILASGDVLDRSRARFESHGHTFRVKGKAQPVTAYAVGTLTGVRDEEVGGLPLVGREAEITALRDAVEGARGGQTKLVELVGEPGIGKSRLVHELRTLAGGFDQLEARCERYAQSIPFFAWRNVLRRLAGIAPDQSPVEAGAQLTPWIRKVVPDLAPWLPLLAIPADAEVAPTPEADSIDEAFRLDRLNDVVQEFLERTVTTPTLLVFEDAHWMDDASRYLLRHVTAGSAERPWLVCVTRRPEGEDVVREGSDARRLVLEPLAKEDAAKLALAAAEEQALSDVALSTLAERSGGNPLFVRELIAASREGGSLEALPETVETLMTTRIDTLPPPERLLLRYAAVVGPRFDLSLLSEILADELTDTRELSRWERLSDFVTWEGAETLAFRHDLFRATAYEGLSFRRRREIHGRVGAALETRAGARVDEAAALLSLHFHEAQKYEQAWRYAAAAAEGARAKYANVVAGELYERALEAARHLDLPAGEVSSTAEALGDVAERFGDYEKAGAAYGEARGLVPDDGEAQARLMLKEGVLRERSGEYEDALAWYEDALRKLDSFGLDDATNQELSAQLELAYAGVRHRQGRFADTVEWARRASEHAERAEDRRELAHAYYLLDVAHTRLGRPDSTFRERALPMLEEVGDLIGQAAVLNNLGVDAYYEGRWEEALDAYRRSGQLSRQAGDVVSGARATNNEAEILSDQGRLEEAGERFDEALRVWRAARYPVGVALATSNLGRVAARVGRFEEAHSFLEQARDEFERIGADAFVHETNARIAECLVLEGRYKEANELAAATLAGANSEEASVLGAALERMLGYAAAQGRKPAEESREHLDRSLEQARSLGAQFEVALTLKAMADIDGSDDSHDESERMLASLAVISVPSPPLP